jgi:hypothetical protein
MHETFLAADRFIAWGIYQYTSKGIKPIGAIPRKALKTEASFNRKPLRKRDG